MPELHFRNLHGHARSYSLPSGHSVVLQLTKDGDKVLITMNEARPHKVFGRFVFRKQFNDTFDLVEMSTEPHQRQGLGRAALRYFHFENENKPVYVDPNDEHGNALSADAKGFVDSKRKEGLIKGYKESQDHDPVFLDL